MNLIKLLYPDRCPYCNRVILSELYACHKCAEDFPDKGIETRAIGGYRCVSAFLYQDKFCEAVLRFKFSNYPQYAEKLAFAVKNAMDNTETPDVVTFVPMYIAKQRRRGYNQAELLAKELAKLLSVPYEELIIKHKDNKEQHKCKSYRERRNNVKGVYKTVDKSRIEGKSILVIDDIITSGNTLGECCRLLEKAKARHISCATVCVVNK
ncbi:MAG: phosphoribosyltransferase family protein [Ruminococcus sp.]|nr:phosphoribosyltransferase family protein [Ruminococcus sp.]